MSDKKRKLVQTALAVLLLAAVLVGYAVYKYSAPQSRFWSRVSGEVLWLKYPTDLKIDDPPRSEVLGVSVDEEGHKNLVYWDHDGILTVREYSNFGVLQSVIKFRPADD